MAKVIGKDVMDNFLRAEPQKDLPASVGEDGALEQVQDFYAWIRDYWIELSKGPSGEDTHMLNFGFWDESTSNLYEAHLRFQEKLYSFLAGIQEGMSGLEIGCGIGGVAVNLVRSRKVYLTCLDLVKDQLERTQALAAQFQCSQSMTFRQGDAMAMPFDDESFDFSYCIESTFHYQDKAAFAGENFRILRPGSLSIVADITCTNPEGVRFRSGNYFCSGDSLQMVLEDAGFEVLKRGDFGPHVFKPLRDYLKAFSKSRNDKLSKYWNLVLTNYAALAAEGIMGYEIFQLRKPMKLDQSNS